MAKARRGESLLERMMYGLGGSVLASPIGLVVMISLGIEDSRVLLFAAALGFVGGAFLGRLAVEYLVELFASVGGAL